MAELGIEELVGMADHLFKKQAHVLSHWQTLADNFYPERSDFVMGGSRPMIAELADYNSDSYPILTRRELGNSFHSMLRQDPQWFRITVDDYERLDRDGKLYLEFVTQRQHELMRRRESNFDRSVKEGDHDFATFGNTVISVQPNRQRNGIVYHTWHLRDCAWEDDENGQVGTVVRNWKPTRHQLIRTFGTSRLSARTLREAEKNPFDTETCYHLVLPAEVYYKNDVPPGVPPWISFYIEKSEKKVIERTPLWNKVYVVPRFQTIAGSPYAYSPCTIAGLPDARTLQAMTHTLLEAAERYARPPIVATLKAVKSDVNLTPDGVTWVDNEYDERHGAALRSLAQDRGGFPIGNNERTRVYEVLDRAFYLHSLFLPLMDKEMTAYEVQERMKQYRLQNLPLFAPMETDYNGQICDITFDLSMRMGMFGSTQEIPDSLQGRETVFRYRSPLSLSEQEKRFNQFQQVSLALRDAAELDQGVVDNVDFDTALRDALEGLDAPMRWLVPPEVRDRRREQDAQATIAMQAAQAAGAAA